MLKKMKIASTFSTIIEYTADETVKKNLKNIDLNSIAKDEELSDKTKSQVEIYLLNRLENNLNDRYLKGMKFEVYTHINNKKIDTKVDIAGFLELEINGRIIQNAYLAHSKIGGNKSIRDKQHAYCSSLNIKNGIRDLLKLSTDSFVFIYTKKGIFTIPALQLKFIQKDNITTNDFYYKKFDNFYENIFKCFIGDHKLFSDLIISKNIGNIVDKIPAKNIIFIRGRQV